MNWQLVMAFLCGFGTALLFVALWSVCAMAGYQEDQATGVNTEKEAPN